MLKLKRITALTFAASIALAGCSSSPSDDSSEADPSATEAPTVEQTEAPEPEAEVEPEPEAEPESGAKPAEFDAEPATGDKFTGTGYTFNGPDGWEEVPDGTVPAMVELAIADLADTSGFATNVTVLLSPAGELALDLIESSGAQELESGGATAVKVHDRVALAGAEAVHMSAEVSIADGESLANQFYIPHDGETYIVTFSFHQATSDADRAGVYESVLASWSWA